jgi:adenylate cyclase
MMKKVGKGNFNNWIFGMLNKPREDERIFMFIDMKSSTSIAEKLSHEKFSHLVQDVFNDLAVVDNYMGEIYQYMGDGAIISWPLNKGLKNNNFLRAFYGFSNLLNKRDRYYQNKYGLSPKFKAGVHVGKVMVLQVGRIRRDISYNGDTLNTTARIESMCNAYNKSLLISGDLYNMMIDKDEYYTKEVGNIKLKGKRRKVDIFYVRPKRQTDKETSPYANLIPDKLNFFKDHVSLYEQPLS